MGIIGKKLIPKKGILRPKWVDTDTYWESIQLCCGGKYKGATSHKYNKKTRMEILEGK